MLSGSGLKMKQIVIRLQRIDENYPRKKPKKMLSGLKMKRIVIRLQRIDENYPRNKLKFEPLPPFIKPEEGSVVKQKLKEPHCKLCNRSFTTLSGLFLHSRSHKYRQEGIVYSCPKCGKVFQNKDRLASHTRAQHNLKPAKQQPSVCAYCGKVCRNKDRLASHTRAQHNLKPKKQPSVCAYCGKVYPCLSLLENHMVVHTKEKHFQCNKCKASFLRKYSLKRHSKTHTDMDIKCSECQLYFPSRKQLESHEETHHGIQKPATSHPCGDCGSEFPTKDELFRHSKIHRKPRVPVVTVCPYCDKQCVTNSRLMRHIFTHTKEKSFECEKCKMSFSWKKGLIKHSKTHTDQDVKCKQCELRFSCRNKLKFHEETHLDTAKVSKAHLCGNCGLEFPSYPKLLIHSKTHRPERVPKVTTCHYCDKQFASHWVLLSHIRIHTKEKPFQCHKCKLSFSWKQDLRKHSKRHTEMDVKCPECELYFPSRNKLESHEETHHGIVKVPSLYSCGNCEHEFSTYAGLLSHSKIHRPERVPKVTTCPYCDKQFASHWRLIVHIRIHTKEKPFQCPKCKLSFSWKHSLERHYKSHTDMDFKCQKCELRFSRRYRLESHEEIHHGIVKAPTKHSCGDCSRDFPTKAELLRHSSKDHTGTIKDKSRVPVIHTCQYCGKTLASKYHLDRHIATHTPKSFCCSVCQTTFSSNCNLTNHSKIHMEKFHCTQCNKKVAFRYIGRHMKTHEPTNGTEPTTVCKLCGKKLSSPQMLELHYKRHKGEKDFKCNKEGCNKAYVSKIGLNRHQRRACQSKVLTAMEDLTCKTCNQQRCMSKFGLQCHKQIHAEDLPSFVCDICHTAYDCNEDLQVHKEVHIGTLEEHNYCSSLVSAQKETGLESERLIQNISHTYQTRVHSHQIQKLKCVNCDKTFYNVNQLVRHMKLHHQLLKNKISSQTGINDTSRKSDETAALGEHQSFVGPGNTSNTGTGNGDGADEGSSSKNNSPKKREMLPKADTNILQATTKLQAWIFQHHAQPHPSEDQKKQLALDTGLTMIQVNNWFLAAKCRMAQLFIDQSSRTGVSDGAYSPDENIREAGDSKSARIKQIEENIELSMDECGNLRDLVNFELSLLQNELDQLTELQQSLDPNENTPLSKAAKIKQTKEQITLITAKLKHLKDKLNSKTSILQKEVDQLTASLPNQIPSGNVSVTTPPPLDLKIGNSKGKLVTESEA